MPRGIACNGEVLCLVMNFDSELTMLMAVYVYGEEAVKDTKQIALGNTTALVSLAIGEVVVIAVIVGGVVAVIVVVVVVIAVGRGVLAVAIAVVVVVKDYAVLFAKMITRTAKDIDVLIDNLPSEDSSTELQVASLQKLEVENQEAAEKLEEIIAKGEHLLKTIQKSLEEIAASQLHSQGLESNLAK
ncbi:mediator of RNA polymerase II transcription subunit 21 [Elysia marginata]|uniref:Mediator of RNA polymerase II transcription subunit 21 n=1 Tax=Elysia marginata TaxID=1093978 RepID=A0AAV4H6C7_9GAST|nr:mediator of RNA polymerase II transcription subunit 21 [Elysia marginata]